MFYIPGDEELGTFDIDEVADMLEYGGYKKKAEGGVIELKNGGNVPRRTRKRKTKNPNIARGCGAVMSSRRKVTKFR